uniref:Proline rich and Gla domain 2 n=1 Tax=Aotus nancymaae TaxID=37293 RepID=A0A2K5ESX5_AOTNA
HIFGPELPESSHHWDLELFTPGNLERECLEEKYDTLTGEASSPGGHGRVDVAGLAVGLTCGILVIVLAGLGAFWYLHWRRRRGHQPCPQEAGVISPLSPLSPLGPSTPLPPPPPPGLPTYEQALAASGVHDAPPPPYSSLRRPH